ncbi:putative NAD kinase [Ascobolus immersus RN42]|uniref:Putative NAD kinase n=1 Tax=Ascobolus immersus RN42 TaxID=1160509 RepID=A0A3N4I2X2_ASCIM|nr:putative NAD kinase [Ascobolus immersus RN42]
MDIKKILIVVKHHDDSLPPRASELVAWLLAQPESFTVYVEDMLRSTESFNAEGLIRDLKDGDKRIKYWTKDFCIETAQSIDLVITLGGDGTVLFASCMFQHVVPPVVSFALGSFGFMTRHDFSEHRTILRKMFSEGFSVCLRARFAGRVMRSIPNDMPVEGRNLEAEMLKPNPNVATHELVEEFTALNEIVVDRGKNSTVSLTDIYTLDQRVASVMADGLIISTPTGSTAYNLAAGGSLCHPDMSAILITPICPHSLTLRPIMLPDSMVIRLGLPYHARTTSSASFDGRQTVELQRGDYVQVSVSRFPFAVVQSDGGCDKDWFESIGRDFGWGIRKV